jgi:hypothetical protein
MKTQFGWIVFFSLATAAAASAQSLAANSSDFFEEKIRPVLVKNCYSCHTTSQMSGLRLDSAEAMAKGGKRGAAVVAGNPTRACSFRRSDKPIPL